VRPTIRQNLVFEIGEDHAGHVVLEGEAKALLALRERLGSGQRMSLELGANLLRCSPDAVVADHRYNPLLAVKAEGRKGDVDREFVAVAAQEREIQAGTHLSRARLPRVLAAMCDMLTSSSRRHEHLNGLTNEFVARVAG
jgi:hypothetical protein